ncbi:MAG: hypothetical protein RSP_04930 [Rhodanobacter sp.]
MSALSVQMKLRKPAAETAGTTSPLNEASPAPVKDDPFSGPDPFVKTQPEQPSTPKMEGSLKEAVRARPYSPHPSSAKQDALTARDKAIEEAARYADLRPDALKQAQDAKHTWQKAAGKLDQVKEAHQEWRQDHRFSSWLHDKGLWKSGALAKHEDRERRHTSHVGKLNDKHETAREEVQRLDTHLSRAQEQARNGWARLDDVSKQEQKQSQSTDGSSRGPEPAQKSERGYQNHEAITHTAGTAALAGGTREDDAPKVSAKESDMTGVLMNHGHAPYKFDPDNSDSYFVTLKDQGKETTHWGKDLGRAMETANAKPGDRLRLERTGQDQTVEVQENVRNAQGQVVGTQETQAVRRGWSVDNLSAPAPKPEAQPVPPEVKHRTLSEAVAARSPFAALDSPEANQPDPTLQPEALGQKRRMRV